MLHRVGCCCEKICSHCGEESTPQSITLVSSGITFCPSCWTYVRPPSTNEYGEWLVEPTDLNVTVSLPISDAGGGDYCEWERTDASSGTLNWVCGVGCSTCTTYKIVTRRIIVQKNAGGTFITIAYIGSGGATFNAFYKDGAPASLTGCLFGTYSNGRACTIFAQVASGGTVTLS